MVAASRGLVLYEVHTAGLLLEKVVNVAANVWHELTEQLPALHYWSIFLPDDVCKLRTDFVEKYFDDEIL